MSSAFSQIDEKGALTGGPDAHALEAPVPSRLLKAKEFAAVLGIDLRHLRRLQKLGHVAPIKRPGSCRIVGYSLEEVARIVTSRVKAGKGYDREVADEFGYGPFLAAVTAAAELEQTRSSPQRFGELNAMGALAPHVKAAITPFFDFPRKPGYKPETFAAAAHGIATGLKKHWGTDSEFYFDDLDVSQKLTVEGHHQYAYALKALSALKVIPVVSLGRTAHNDAVAQLKRKGGIASTTVAVRVEQPDFEDFGASEDEIGSDLSEIFQRFDAVDLILDCRLCTGMDASETALQIANFAHQFAALYPVRRVVVTGSSLPASIGEIVKSNSTEIIRRHELSIITAAREHCELDIVPGDYATVSPFYSDKEFDPRILQKVTAPRLIYSFDHSHYVDRGVSLSTGGQRQYHGMTKDLCSQGFFRKGYSFGEAYFTEKSKGIGNNATNATVVKPSVVAHITYMVMGAKL